MFPLIYDEKPDRYTYTDDNARRHSFQPVRISTSLRLHRGADFSVPIGKALIDTGAPLTVFPHKVWKDWAPEAIRWLDPADASPANATNVRWGGTQNVAIARIGLVRLSLQASSKDGTKVLNSQPMDVMAKFLAETTAEWPQIVLGICGNALNHFYELEIQFKESRAMLWKQSDHSVD